MNIQRWLEQRGKFETYNKHYIRPADSKKLTIMSRRDRVLGIEESESKRQSEGEFNRELHAACCSAEVILRSTCFRDGGQSCEQQ